MRQCWADGDLRAYLDGELPRETRQQVDAHLQACEECAGRHAEIAGRAARVAQMLAILPENLPVAALPVLPRPASHRRHWAMAALSLAAALAIAFVALPKRREPVSAAPAPVPVAARTEAVAPAPVAKAAAPVRTMRHTAAPRTVVHEDFLRLDDDPIETGVVVRVATQSGDMQADLIVGPDGRARAIRLVRQQ
jgi:anti-sigma factor RsiW